MRRYGLAVALIALAVMLRALPHPANVAPLTATALFAGAVLPRQRAVWVALGAAVLSDLVIGWYDYRVMGAVWACYALTAWLSSRWCQRMTRSCMAVATLTASLGFFVITNFAVWASSGMYTYTARGLLSCYVMALPFLRNSLLSDLLYTTILCTAWQVSRWFIQQPRLQEG